MWRRLCIVDVLARLARERCSYVMLHQQNASSSLILILITVVLCVRLKVQGANGEPQQCNYQQVCRIAKLDRLSTRNLSL